MNLPNKLTTARVVLIPLFLLALYGGYWLAALVIFALASITDALDGHIARSRGLVTDFGKFMDVPAWVVFLIIARELAITGLRTLAAGKGVVMAADKWGKVKTASQMVWICYGLVMGFCFYNLPLGSRANWEMYLIFQAGMVVVLCTTLFSGGNYLWKNRQLFSQMK